jgi:hypothetical protein
MLASNEHMYIDPFNMSTSETICMIITKACIPKEDKYFDRYFMEMNDNRNKDVLFRIALTNSHIKWRNLLSKELKALNVHMLEHELESNETKVVGFLMKKHPKLTNKQ